MVCSMIRPLAGRLLIILMFFLYACIAKGQIDLSLNYQRPHFTDWDQVVNERYQDDTHLFSQVFGATVAYRYYPFDFRLGFTPEIGISFIQEDRASVFYQANYQLMQFQLGVPIQIFPFDFYGDCNCPTFGKQNDFLQKAVYFKFIPAVSFDRLSYGDGTWIRTTDLSWSIGGAIGLNFAINDRITIAPEFGYHELLGHEWNGFAAWHEQPAALDNTAAYGYRFSIRFSFYPG